jgi:sec-independent protein translocase protein TatA
MLENIIFHNVLAFGLGAPEILIIALGILLLFGAKKIPELMRGLGGGIKEFKTAMKDEEEKGKIESGQSSNSEKK